MELIREKFRETKNNFRKSTKTNFQIFKFLRPQVFGEL